MLLGLQNMKNYDISTALIHHDHFKDLEYGSIRSPIYTSVQYGVNSVEDLIDIFQGRKKGAYNYSRQGTPSTASLEERVTLLEKGIGSICFSSGMAALATVFFTLLKSGDHIVSSKSLFGNTKSLLNTIENLGVEVTFIDTSSEIEISNSIKPNTKLFFVETIANPTTRITLLEEIGILCEQHKILYVVDNTITSPALFTPYDVKASLVVNSLSKIMSGHAAALGGVITDTGLFDWTQYTNIAPIYRSTHPKQQGLLQMRKKGLRDMGASLSSEQAHQISLGLETFTLRVNKSSENAQLLSNFLNTHPKIKKVHFPGLVHHPEYNISKKLFKSNSWLLSFELKQVELTNNFLNLLSLPIKATGLGDTRTLIIPVASTIFWEAGPIVRKDMQISDGLIRVSVGLENIQDLINDFTFALNQL